METTSLGCAYLPRIYAFDVQNMAFVMEFLGSFELLQRSLFAGNADHRIATGMGKIMGLLHSQTHCARITSEESKRLSSAYENGTLRGIQLEYVFSKCYREDNRASHLRDDAVFMAEVEKLKDIYRGKQTDNLALCHGDLHAGSVMADTSSGHVKIIDPEFAVYGPPGLDVGSLVSTYAMAYCYHTTLNNAPASGLLEGINKVFESYEQTMSTNGVAAAQINQAVEDAVGFAGCEIARTALGMAYERSLKIDDEATKAKAEKAALAAGVACIMNRRKRKAALIDVLKTFG